MGRLQRRGRMEAGIRQPSDPVGRRFMALTAKRFGGGENVLDLPAEEELQRARMLHGQLQGVDELEQCAEQLRNRCSICG